MNKSVSFSLVGVAALILFWLFFTSGSSAGIEALPQTIGTGVGVGADIEPANTEAGVPSTMVFRFTRVDGTSVTDLAKHHERLLHVVLVGEDLGSIGHIHPEDFPELNQGRISGEYAVRYTFPSAGKYIVSVDAMDIKGPISRQFIVQVAGAPVSEKNVLSELFSGCFNGTKESTEAYSVSEMMAECPNGYSVTAEVPQGLAAGDSVQLKFHVEKDGKPLTDMTPYLGAAMHLAIIPDTLDTTLHRHVSSETKGMMMDMGNGVMMMHGSATADTFGPDATSEPIVFPHAGVYRMFVQFKHHDELVIAPLVVIIRE
jgi:P-type Cu+ transporter